MTWPTILEKKTKAKAELVNGVLSNTLWALANRYKTEICGCLVFTINNAASLLGGHLSGKPPGPRTFW